MPEISCFLNSFMLPGLRWHNCVFCSVKLPNGIFPVPIPTYTVVCTHYCAQEHMHIHRTVRSGAVHAAQERRPRYSARALLKRHNYIAIKYLPIYQ